MCKRTINSCAYSSGGANGVKPFAPPVVVRVADRLLHQRVVRTVLATVDLTLLVLPEDHTTVLRRVPVGPEVAPLALEHVLHVGGVDHLEVGRQDGEAVELETLSDDRIDPTLKRLRRLVAEPGELAVHPCGDELITLVLVEHLSELVTLVGAPVETRVMVERNRGTQLTETLAERDAGVRPATLLGADDVPGHETNAPELVDLSAQVLDRPKGEHPVEERDDAREVIRGEVLRIRVHHLDVRRDVVAVALDHRGRETHPPQGQQEGDEVLNGEKIVTHCFLRLSRWRPLSHVL